MMTATAKQGVLMAIMIRYRCCRYLMSSDIGRRAWVTRCTCCPRAWPVLILHIYLGSASPPTRSPGGSPGAVARD